MATGGAIKAGEAFIELTLKGARNFQQGLRSAVRSMGRLAVAAAKVGVALTAAFGAATLAIVTKTVREFVKFGDAMQKMSLRTGIGAEALSELRFAAEQSGTNIDQLSQAMFRATRRIGNAVTETGPAVRALQELNLAAAALAELRPEDQFERLVDALSGVANESRRSQLAFEIFGDNWRQIAPLINVGTEGIQNLREQARILGATVSQEQADRAAALADRWNELKTAFRGVAIEIGSALAPALENALVQMRNFLLDWREWLADLQLETARAFVNIGEFLGLGDMAEGARVLEKAFQFRRAFTSARERPSERFQRLLNQQEPTKPLAKQIGDAIQQVQRKTTIGGLTRGSFAGDVRQFGVQSVGRKQLRVLERLEDIQERQLERLEQTGFFAFL